MCCSFGFSVPGLPPTSCTSSGGRGLWLSFLVFARSTVRSLHPKQRIAVLRLQMQFTAAVPPDPKAQGLESPGRARRRIRRVSQIMPNVVGWAIDARGLRVHVRTTGSLAGFDKNQGPTCINGRRQFSFRLEKPRAGISQRVRRGLLRKICECEQGEHRLRVMSED